MKFALEAIEAGSEHKRKREIGIAITARQPEFKPRAFWCFSSGADGRAVVVG